MNRLNLLSISDRGIEKIENFKISPLVLILYLTFIISLRAILEQIFFEKQFSIYQFMHHFFFFILLLSGTLIISSIGKIEIFKVTKIVLSGFFLITIPPVVDHLILGRNFPYGYILPKDFLENFTTFFLFTPKVSVGIIIEIGAILLLASFYVLMKSHSLLRAILTGFSLYILAAIAGTPRLLLPIPDMTDPVMYHARHIIYFLFYFVLTLVVGMFFLYKVDKKFPAAIIKELGSFRTLHCILMLNAGMYFNESLDFLYFPDIIYILSANILIVLLWLCSILVNNVYDLEIDKISNPDRPLPRGDVSPFHYLGFSSVLSILVLIVSLVLGVIPFILSLMALLSSLAYSMPPLRLRKKIFSTMFIGWGSVLAFFIGYTCRTKIQDFSISHEALILTVLIFMGFSTGTLTKDLKDYSGDRYSGVRTLFTVFGIQKGIKIAAIFLGISLLIPIFLFHEWWDILTLGFSAIFFSGLFILKKKVAAAYLGYVLAISYCVIRILGWI